MEGQARTILAGFSSHRAEIMADTDIRKRARILVVEDHADTLAMMDRLLRIEGDYEVIAVADSAGAIVAARDTRFGLLIIDIGLPDGSGVALLKQLLFHGPCRALALTGYDMPAHIKQYREGGFDEWLIKPVNLDLLLSTVRRILGDGRAD